jgi:8-oxo-dGTP pyrophosphatase MutT (NUDIX family)
MLPVSRKHFLCAVLLCKRTLDAPVHPAYWALFGGRIDPGEQPKHAALREVQEELGLSRRQVKLADLCDVRIRRDDGSDALTLRYFHSALALDMDCLTLRRSSKEAKVEGQGLGWFTAEEIHHMVVRPEDRIAIDTFFQRHGP